MRTLLCATAFALTDASSVHAPVEPSLRSIWNPSSLGELSRHVRLIRLADTTTSARFVGAAGAVFSVVAKTVLAYSESPIPW